jgi:two-component system sensor histidine kinase TctE
LRQRIALWLLLPLTLLVATGTWQASRAAKDAANRAYDRSLLTALHTISESVHSIGGRVTADIPVAALTGFDDVAQDRVFYAIVGPDGGTLTGYPDLRAPAGALSADQELIVDARYRGYDVRLGMIRKNLYDPDVRGGDTVTILVAETLTARTQLAQELFRASLQRQVLLAVVGIAAALLALTLALRPLLATCKTIGQRSERDLTPIPTTGTPSEIVPLIDAINHHMTRLDQMLLARRRFLADAAHQLRTPLAVLTTQADVGLRQDDAAEMQQTFGSMMTTIRSARRMVNQMLTLSRIEAAGGVIAERSRLDVARLAREVAGELTPLALQRHIDLSLEGADLKYPVDANAPLLREMVANVLDNALRYTPPGGHVALSLLATDAMWVTLQVADDGPGIPAAERERVFQRFYRLIDRDAGEGSGLGLAIVREICWGHGGNISLEAGPQERGLRVVVRLPRANGE